MKYWKTLVVVFSFTLFFLFIPFRTSKGCGGYEDVPNYTFLYPQLLEQKTDFSPYILLDDYPEQYLTDTQARKLQRQKNLQEWSDFSCETENLKDIERVVYTSSVEDLQKLRRAARKGKVPNRWKENTFATGLIKSKCTATLDYLLFAKFCEPHAISGARWDTERTFDTEKQELIDLGKKQMLKTDNHFLRLRYMYQIVRLAHYADDYNYALELYKELDYKVDDVPSIIKWWLLGHKAGCLKRLGQNVESAYLFSKIFKNCPSKREQVFRSFYIQDDDEWNACIKRCESDEERATLYVMRAMDTHSRVSEEMENIYRLFPQSEDLLPLLIKEVKEIEPHFIGTSFKSNTALGTQKTMAHRLIKLEKIVRKILSEEKVKNLDVWTLTHGYIEYLRNDIYAAQQSYQKARQLIQGNEKLEKQLDIFETVLRIHNLSNMNPSTEDEVLDIIKRNKNYKSIERLPDFLFERIAALYEKQENKGKEFLCLHELSDLQRNPEKEVLHDLLALAENKNRTDFETYLLEEKLGENFISSLYDIKGTVHLAQYELPEALRSFNKVDSRIMSQRTFTPFYLPIKDCIHCPSLSDSNTIIVNKLELVEKLLDYEYKAKTDMEDAAKYYYLLGAAFYNMSYYGREHEILDTFRHSWNWGISPKAMQKEIAKEKKLGLFGDVDYTDVSKALFFFDKSRELANSKELGARASFMAAKCQLAQFYQDEKTDYSYWTNKAPVLPDKYSTYYDLLVKKYSDTEFFEEVIEECSFFAVYAEKNWRE